MSSDKSGHRLPVAFETKADFQFVGHKLEVGRLLQRDKFPEEGESFRWPVRPMIAT